MLHTKRLAYATLRLSLATIALVSGCAELNDADSTANPSEFDHLEPAELEGMRAILFRRSSICVPRTRIGLDATVGSDIEFLSEEVAELSVPCADAPSPGHEVYFVDNSVIFEFRDLVEPVTFPESELEGYEIRFDRDCGDPVVVDMVVDDTLSDMEFGPDRVEAHFERIVVNFAGLTVEPDSFLKVDLRVVSIGCNQHRAN